MQNGHVELAYVKGLDQQKKLAVGLVVCVLIIAFSGLLFDRKVSTDLITHVVFPLSAFIGACWACITAYRAHRGPVHLGLQHTLAWLLIGMGLLATCFGEVYSAYVEKTGLIGQIPSVISGSDLGFTLFYP